MGNFAISFVISNTVVAILTVSINSSISKVLSSFKNLSRFIDPKLHAVFSKKKYSEHGLDDMIGPLFLHVCHVFIVFLNCTPGSAHTHAASEILLITSSAVVSIYPPFILFRRQPPLSLYCLIKLSEIKIELFEFCPETVV